LTFLPVVTVSIGRLPCRHQPTGLNILYLHGFASGPQSRKALFFKEKLGSQGIRVDIPDLAEGDFEHLTVRRQIKFIEQLVGNEAVTLIGSSLGGYLAALYAARHREIQRLVLLAPAFGFYSLWVAALGNERLARWRREGTMNVFHYAEGKEMPLSYDFIQDAESLAPFPVTTQPVLIFHGDRDPVVPAAQSLQFLQINPHAKLVRFSESGHELTDVLESIWEHSEDFLLAGSTSV
jgi:pimeloyl-ACP methyl ester carboxylesterase